MTETKPTDLAALFALDPLQMTKDDVREIVEEYRRRRSLFNAGNLKAGKPVALRSGTPKLSLGDIDL